MQLPRDSIIPGSKEDKEFDNELNSHRPMLSNRNNDMELKDFNGQEMKINP